jgi:AcrR family transcriptional regulator
VSDDPDRPAPTDGEIESKGERTRRRLLEIAIRRFGEGGYRQTSVTDVTREAGLTQAASYAYFGSKSELYREAVNTDAMDLIRGASQQAAAHEPRQLLPALVLYLGGALPEHPLTQRVLQGQEGEGVGELVDLPAVHELGRVVADGIRRGQADGTVRADIDPDSVAAGAEALILGLTISLAMSGGAATERHAFGVVSAFDAMLRPAP